MNANFAKLIAVAIVGGVAKALFREPDTYVTNNINSQPEPLTIIPEESN